MGGVFSRKQRIFKKADSRRGKAAIKAVPEAAPSPHPPAVAVARAPPPAPDADAYAAPATLIKATRSDVAAGAGGGAGEGAQGGAGAHVRCAACGAPGLGAELDPILKLAASIFASPVAVVLFDGGGWVTAARGAGGDPPGGRDAWLAAACACAQAQADLEVTLVPDLHADARFQAASINPFPRSFCGAPLVGSGRARLGVFCVGSAAPRSFDGAQVALAESVAAMLVRELEATASAAAVRAAGDRVLAAVGAAPGLDACAALARPHAAPAPPDAGPRMVVRVSPGGDWTVAHANDAACAAAQGPREAVVGAPFWDLFGRVSARAGAPRPTDAPWMGVEDDAGCGREFTLRGLAPVGLGGSAAWGGSPSPCGRRSCGPSATAEAAATGPALPLDTRLSSSTSDAVTRASLLGGEDGTLGRPAHRPPLPRRASAHAGLGGAGSGPAFPSFRSSSDVDGDASAAWPAESDADGDADAGCTPLDTSVGSLSSTSTAGRPVYTMHFRPVFHMDGGLKGGGGSSGGGWVGGGGGDEGSSTSIAPSAPAPYRAYIVTLHAKHSVAAGVLLPGDAGDGLGCRRPVVVPPALPGLALGVLLGTGSYGRVYAGTLHGTPVAVKVVDAGQVRTAPDGRPLEAALAAPPAHARVVACLAHATVPSAEGGGQEAWLLLEHCDLGPLQDAVERGVFGGRGHGGGGGGGGLPPATASAPPQPSPVAAAAIAATAADVAGALAHLHGRGVLHGDLAGGNVLLATDPTDPRGFVAKVSDFGLAVVGRGGAGGAAPATPSATATPACGTVTHMPPERLRGGPPTPAADVYSLGVLLWSMLAGARPWAGLGPARVLHAVALEGRTLAVPLGAPPTLAAVTASCLAADPASRPSAAEVAASLRAALASGELGGW